jgi:hypothetical protein
MTSAVRFDTFVALSLVVFVACSRDGQAPGESGDPCDALSAARCMQQQTCAPIELAVRFGDLTTCKSQEYFACLG